MSKVYLEDSTLTAIGNAIRGKTGESGLLLPSEMASAITNIPTGGGSSELVMKKATITPTSTAKVINLSPWITDANVNDWFLFGAFGYWSLADSGSSMVAPKVIGPLFKDFTPTKGTASTRGWAGMGFGHEYANVPAAPTTAGLRWDYYGGKGWESRMPTWDAAAKTLTVTDTKFLGKQQMILVYREV